MPPVAPPAAVPVLPVADVPPLDAVPVLPVALVVEDDEGVVEVVLEEVFTTMARLPVGTVSGGAPALFVVDEPPPPQAETPTERATPDRKMPMRRERLSTAKGGQDSRGAMRRPQLGQSFRSFWESWSHQLQNRRFSTDHGSSDAVGASGSSCATTSSGSPVSRSTYSTPDSASMITSRPVEGVRMRYFWRVLMDSSCYQRAPSQAPLGVS